MIDGSHQRILRATAASLSWQPLGSSGEPADPGTVTVAVADSDGTVVLAAGTATVGAATAARTVGLTVSQTADLDRLTATWKVGGAVHAVTYHDIVGGFYFSSADLRNAEPSTASAARDTPAKILAARSEVEAVFEAHGRPGFVPRFAVERLTSYGRNGRQMLAGWPLRAIRWVRLYSSAGTAAPTTLDYTAGELAGTFIDPDLDVAVFPTRFDGYQSVHVGYEYGLDAMPPDGKAAAMTLARSFVNRHRSGVPDRAVSMTTADGMSVQLGRVGTPWRPTGLDSVDEFLIRPEFRRVCIG